MSKTTLPSPLEIEIARLLIECVLELMAIAEEEKLELEKEFAQAPQASEGGLGDGKK